MLYARFKFIGTVPFKVYHYRGARHKCYLTTLGKADVTNAALLTTQILELHNTLLANCLSQWQQHQTNEVLNHQNTKK